MLELLAQRRSIRKYRQTPVEKEILDKLIKAALLAPSSRNILSQRFIVIDRPELLEKLSQARDHGSSFLKNAPLAIVVLGDSSSSDVWNEDASLAAIIIQLTATSLGLGSCWIQIRNRRYNQDITSEEYIQRLLNIPEDMKVQCIISLGYSDEQKSVKTEQDLKPSRVSINSFGQQK